MGWIVGGIVLALVFGPMLWVKAVMARHQGDRPDFPGTGGELARHLLDSYGLEAVQVEETPAGDHYDPASRTVRLTRPNFQGRSITSVAVAAHEVGHALQHADGMGLLTWRQRLVRTAMVTDRVGSIALLGLSVVGSAALSPRLLLVGIGAVVLMGLVRVIAHLVTLPVEVDASFNRALPVLRQGRYLPDRDLPAARAVLRAAAFTYVAAALMQMLNLFRIVRLLR